MTLEVYWGSGSPYVWRVLLGLEVKQIPYESKRLSFSERDLKSPEFLAINPRGKVPAIKEGSFTLHESVAILRYLDDKEPQPPLFGKTAAERGSIWCAIMECVSYVEPAAGNFTAPIFFGQLEEKRDKAIKARQAAEKEFTTINTTLTERAYLVNDSITAADNVLYPFIKFTARAAGKENTDEVSGTLRNIDEHYEALSEWCRRIEAIPGYDNTYPPHWKES